MSCMILLAPQATVSTIQLVRPCCEGFQLEQQAPQRKQSLRMSWVVVTDQHGKRQLRMRWRITG
jgi:hypothetical protein